MGGYNTAYTVIVKVGHEIQSRQWSINKVAPNNCDNDRQPEVAIWPPKNRGYLYLWNYDR